MLTPPVNRRSHGNVTPEVTVERPHVRRPTGDHGDRVGTRRGRCGRSLANPVQAAYRARNTILTLITRLVAKGWLVPRREGNAFRYTAAFEKEAAQAEEVRRLVDTVFDGQSASAGAFTVEFLDDVTGLPTTRRS